MDGRSEPRDECRAVVPGHREAASAESRQGGREGPAHLDHVPARRERAGHEEVVVAQRHHHVGTGSGGRVIALHDGERPDHPLHDVGNVIRARDHAGDDVVARLEHDRRARLATFGTRSVRAPGILDPGRELAASRGLASRHPLSCHPPTLSCHPPTGRSRCGGTPCPG